MKPACSHRPIWYWITAISIGPPQQASGIPLAACDVPGREGCASLSWSCPRGRVAQAGWAAGEGVVLAGVVWAPRRAVRAAPLLLIADRYGVDDVVAGAADRVQAEPAELARVDVVGPAGGFRARSVRPAVALTVAIALRSQGPTSVPWGAPPALRLKIFLEPAGHQHPGNRSSMEHPKKSANFLAFATVIVLYRPRMTSLT